MDSHEMTMAEFVTLALQDELHPKLNIQEDKNMGNLRTLAFQVPEELFQKIKDYLQRNHMTQKEFVIGLIENEIERDLTQRVGQAEQPETAIVSEFKDETEEVEEEIEEQESTEVSGNFEDVSAEENEGEELGDEEVEDLDNEPSEDEESEDFDGNESESEYQGMAMGM